MPTIPSIKTEILDPDENRDSKPKNGESSHQNNSTGVSDVKMAPVTQNFDALTQLTHAQCSSREDSVRRKRRAFIMDQ